MSSVRNRLYLVICGVGIALEYFDFIIFALLAPYIGDNFFPNSQKNAQLLQAFMVFSVGYIVRPVSAVVLGMISDVYGRKNALMLSILCMAFATVIIGVLPGYNSIGIAAPVLLVVARVIQGISHGAEMPLAITYISELNLSKKEFKCSLIYTFASVGAICSLVFCYLLENNFSSGEISSWGWRLPFLSGGLLAIVAIIFRYYALETPEFMNLPKVSKKNLLNDLFKNVKKILIGALVTFPVAIIVILGLFMPNAMQKFFAYEAKLAFKLSLIGMCYYTIVLPILGYMYKGEYRYRIYITSGVSMSIVVIFTFLSNLSSYITVLLFIIMFKTILASLGATYPMILANLFTTNHRNTAVAIGYNMAFSVAALLPTLCLNVVSNADELAIFFIILFTVIAIISVLAGIISKKYSVSSF